MEWGSIFPFSGAVTVEVVQIEVVAGQGGNG